MKIQNVYNNNNKIWMFERNDDLTQKITTDSSYFPYYYEQDPNGAFDTYDNKKARLVTVINPYDIVKRRTGTSYEADLMFYKRYTIDKINTFDKCPIKALFFDIEILANDMPDTSRAIYPVSCISVYNTADKKTKTWYLGDFKSDKQLIQCFVEYVKEEAPDLLLAWNIQFDYMYLMNRYQNFAKELSPIGEERHGEMGNNCKFPAGISILDYMQMFKKVHMREQSYALDKVSQKHLGDTEWGDTDFGVLSEHIKQKNVNDVLRMVRLEEKYKLFNYFDEIRRFAQCMWEDLTQNSRILDMMVLREAKARGVVLPNKKRRDPDSEDEELQGAYRRADAGNYENVYKADVSAMYPSQMINFCLDAQNIRTVESDNTLNINGLIVEQNDNALIPYITRQLIDQKDRISGIMGAIADPNTEEYKTAETKYNAIKGLVNSMYGTIAFPAFRLYNLDIASRITFLSRDLLLYTEEQIKKLGHTVVYTDTDALMYQANQDDTDLLNKLVFDWAIERYSKPDIRIKFTGEGVFTKILIVSKCHYYGYIKRKKDGIVKKEIKGMEIKRSSSSKCEAKFQETLIEKVLNKETKDDIIKWIEQTTIDIKQMDLNEVSFPCKIANKVYKNVPIFVRAYENTQKLVKDLKISKGELFRYIFVKGLADKDITVLIVTDAVPNLKDYIDWEALIERNLISKAEGIFTALGWGYLTLVNGKIHISASEEAWTLEKKQKREEIRAEKKIQTEKLKSERKVAKAAERLAKQLQKKQKGGS